MKILYSTLTELFVICFAISLAEPNNYQWQAGGSHSHEWHQDGPSRDMYPVPGRGKPPRWFGQTTPNPRATCPCVKKKNTGECVTYDPRFQAATVEEAILNFPDLQIGSTPKQSGETVAAANVSGSTAPLPRTANAFGPTSSNDNLTLIANLARSRIVPGPDQSTLTAQQPPNGNAAMPPVPQPSLCGTDRECLACSAALLNRLSIKGLLGGSELDEVSKRLGVQQFPQRGGCDKYKFGTPAVAAISISPRVAQNSTPKAPDPTLDNLVKQLQAKGEENWRKKQAESNRTKRQSSSKPGTTLGQQFKIDCSKRGEPVEQGSSWVGLCNVCWAWRKLPASYFPQYVNELICDKDTKCMSGWGSCQQRYKSVDILQNTGSDANPTWKQVTISVANYCDCEVESGSSMHNFVAA